jgi:hypothetical protein
MRIALGAALAAFVLMAAGPFALDVRFLGNTSSQATDEQLFHLPAIRDFAAGQVVDWTTVRMAMIPGYHVAQSGVFRAGGEASVRLVNLAITVALALLAYGVAERYAGGAAAAIFTLPLVCSPYVLGSGIWITTDNAGWLLAGAVLASSLRGGDGATRFGLRGLGALLTVLVRQVHAWVVIPVVASGIDPMTGRWRVAALARGVIACVPVALALLTFSLIWEGPVPPPYQAMYAAQWNPATPIAILALAGAFGLFFTGMPAADIARQPAARWLLLGVVGLSVTVPTSYAVSEGRWGGPLWELARLLPTVGGRSVALVPLAAVGTAVLIVLYRRAVSRGRSREARILFVSLAAWAAAQTVSMQAFQRYLEPGVLLGLAWLSALSFAPLPDSAIRRRLAGPLILSALQLVIGLLSIYRPLWQ